MIHISFDSSEFMIKALMTQNIDVFVVKTPFSMGYQGVFSVYYVIQGKRIKAKNDTGIIFVNRKNISSENVKKKLNLP
ncbi:hypothetical protein [Psychromonas hadalis]|uniref:hypothetical protein n=1 Tax=Psychromonas hadalis TaxID=211669 RepID=UPI0003B4AEDF|nr:hypothetical protein [Psychromonas hadalis]